MMIKPKKELRSKPISDKAHLKKNSHKRSLKVITS